MKPKWQRARIIKADHDEYIGCLVWVEMGPPQIYAALDRDGEYLPPAPRVRVNVFPELGFKDCSLRLANIELLPEFAESVPFVRREDLLNETRRAAQATL